MTVVGLHPEELFDKLQSGELSPAESDRLRQHLLGCEVCRFEYAARSDFRDEAVELAASPPPALPLRPLALPSHEPKLGAGRATPARRRTRRRLLMVGVAAAALITASAAVAASLTGRTPWPALGAWLSAPAPVASDARPRTPVGDEPRAARPPSLQAPVAPAVAEPRIAAPARPAVTHGAVPTRKPSAPERHVDPATPAAPAASEPAPPIAVEGKPVEPASAAKLFGDANQARRAGDIGRASALYHLLQDRYSASPEAELSRVTLALLQLDNGDAAAALAGFDRYLAGASRGLEAEALVGRARALGRLGRRALEVSAWQEVKRKYPRSIYGRQATERLAALGQP